MSIDFRGQIIAAIQNGEYTTDEKILMISALPSQISEVYFGACRAIVDGDEPVSAKLRLLQATFGGLPAESEYTLAERPDLHGPLPGLPGGSLIVLELRMFGDEGVTPELRAELERALPTGTVAGAGDQFLTVTVDAAHRLDAVEAVRRTLYEHGFIRRDKPSAG